jgi:hypothetical protein
MARPRLLTATLLAAGSYAGSLLYRRRAARRRERVDLYYEDGSMVSLPEGSPGAERLLAIAHDVLAAAR